MSNAIHRAILGVVGVIGAVVLTTTAAFAASLPGRLHALPNPPGAPQHDTFLVTVPHHQVVPNQAVFTFTGAGQHSTTKESFKKLNQYQWETVWVGKQQGHLAVRVYSTQHQLIAQAHYRVDKARNNPVGRVVIGALFIGVSLWFWYRQQRQFRRR